MKRRGLSIGCGRWLAAVVLLGYCAQAGELELKIPFPIAIRQENPPSRENGGFKVDSSTTAVLQKGKDTEELQYVARFRVRLSRKKWSLASLSLPNLRIRRVKPSEYEVEVGLTAERMMIPARLISAGGEVRREPIFIEAPRWAEMAKLREIRVEAPVVAKQTEAPRWSSLVGLGLASLETTQTGYARYSAKALTFKAIGNYRRPGSRWLASGNVFFNLPPLQSNQKDLSVRFLGANLRYGYVFSSVPAPWAAAVSVGINYAQIFSTDADFGFTPTLYPQVYPTISRALGAHDSATFYLKYVPLSSSLLSFTDREIAFGLSWFRQLSNGHQLVPAVDYSNTLLSSKGDRQFRSIILALGVSYSLF